jgi:hypothetical protein
MERHVFTLDEGAVREGEKAGRQEGEKRRRESRKGESYSQWP